MCIVLEQRTRWYYLLKPPWTGGEMGFTKSSGGVLIVSVWAGANGSF
jgi:hypothetical protein